MQPAFLFLLAAAVRLVVALQTEIPARDSATYLWMAEQAASGRPEALFETVFHPVYSALVAGVLILLPSLEGPTGTVVAGQLVACGMGALAVLPLYFIARRLFGVKAAFAAGLFYAVGVWFARHPADGMSEGPFHLMVSSAVLLLLKDEGGRRSHRVVAGGLLCALAYATRPEGAALGAMGVIWLWARGERRYAFLFAVSCLPAFLIPLGFAMWGAGFTLTPKAAFTYGVGVGSGGPGLYLHNLVRLPGAAFEDLGYVVFPLAIWGAVVWRPRTQGDPRTLLLVPFLIQCLVIPLVHSHYRFLSGYGILLMPFAGVGAVAAMSWFLRGRPFSVFWQHLFPVLCAVVVLGGDLVRLPQVRRHDRIVERELGIYLGDRLEPGQGLATDMPRLAYFAGHRPPPPRALAGEEILEACKSETTRYAVLVLERTPVDPTQLTALGFRNTKLPPRLEELLREQRAANRTFLVQERNP